MANLNHAKATVVIIGGGISGICAAVDLLRQRTTDDIIILEKSTGFGGTWRDNRFPGSCCDVWGHLYSYSFDQVATWTHAYPAQEEILQYLMNVARKYDLYKYVRFNTVVEKAVWNNQDQKWDTTVSVTGGKDSEYGASYTIRSNFLVSGVGQLSIPKYPELPGMNLFEGKIMHSARWDWSYVTKGKRVAVIGTGATAAQIIPEVAKLADHLTVIQRSPGWVLPRHDAKIPGWKMFVLTYVPLVLKWYRAGMMRIRESSYYAVTQSDSHHAEGMRQANQAHMRGQLSSRPDLWDKLTPGYSPGCKRSVVSDDYYPTFLRSNVSLETRSIKSITSKGILFDGQESDTMLDLIILATGYHQSRMLFQQTSLSVREPTNYVRFAQDFLHPICFVGIHGISLSQIWDGIPQAYKGVTVQDLPNFGMFYGPNTNLTHNSEILVIEAQSRYISAMIKEVLSARALGKTLSLIVKTDRLKAYNDTLQAKLQKTSFADPGCTSWWKTESGHLPNNWSGTAQEYQEMISSIDWTDFEYQGTGAAAFRSKQNRSLFIGRVKEEAIFSLGAITSSLILFVSVIGGYLMLRLEFI